MALFSVSVLRIPRWLRVLLALILAAGAAVFLRQRYFTPVPPPRYVTAPVTATDIEDAVLASGTLQAFQQVSVGAQVSGQVKTLRVKLGDTVKKGELIAEIDSLTQQNNLRNAEAGVRNVQAQLAAQQAALRQAELVFARQQELFAADAGSRADFDAARASRDTTRANIAALRAQIAQSNVGVDTARINIGYSRIVAPIDGTVVAVIAQQGQTLTAGFNTPTLVKIAQIDRMTVKAQISEADVVRVRPDQKVTFTILGDPDHKYRATLRSIEPAPDSIATDTATTATSAATNTTAVYYNGLFDVPNPDGQLRISMTAQVSIVRSEAKGALTIPSSALGARAADGRTTVRVLGGDGNAAPRQVRIGIDNHVSAQVLEGLAAGEQVVLGDAQARDPAAGGGPLRPPGPR